MLKNNCVSIIIPIYNAEKYLDECIRSVVNQTFPFFEAILVDDGSKDLSGLKCDEWCARDSRLKVVHKVNGGLVSAWKMGLKAALYDWVVFLDSDDWLESQHLEKLIDEKNKNNADVTVTRMKQVHSAFAKYIDFEVEAGNYSGYKLRDKLYPVLLNAGGFEKRGIPVSRCSKLIRKKLLLENAHYCSFDTTYEEDLNIMLPVLLDAKSISLIEVENAAYCYRHVEDSMLHAYDRRMSKSISKVYKSILKACDDKGTSWLIPQIYAEYLTAMVRNYANELQNPAGYKEVKKNISEMSRDKLLQQVIREVEWRNYPLKFKLVIVVFKKNNQLLTTVVTWILMILKKIRK